ncbi:MAG: hypothetical protein GC154_06010 [bacterium]|nr:hypothetical protein [bacterium]
MTFDFSPSQYGPALESLLKNDGVNELGPGSPNRGVEAHLRALQLSEMFAGAPIHDREAALCCQSALWLLFDFLDESHTLSQSIPSTDGSYWHGIMHRREPDYSNAKYWFRRVGLHPVFTALREETERILNAEPVPGLERLIERPAWDAFLFIDLCEANYRENNAAERALKKIQLAEWRFLFDHCYRKALGD